PGGVTLLGDVQVRTLPGYRPLTVDLYLPKTTGHRPAVVWVHGGSWTAGTSRSPEVRGRDWPALLARLSARGYVVASVSYRLDKEATFPSQVQDVEAVIRWVRT